MKARRLRQRRKLISRLPAIATTSLVSIVTLLTVLAGLAAIGCNTSYLAGVSSRGDYVRSLSLECRSTPVKAK